MSTPYFQTDFAPQEFAARRARLIEALGPDSVAVIAGAPETGAFDYFRQHNDFYYLCGVEVPHSYLSIDARSNTTTLYLPHHDPKHERSEGAQLHCDDPDTACRMTGVERVRPLSALAVTVANAKLLVTPLAPGEGAQASQDTLRHAAQAKSADPWRGSWSFEEKFRARLTKLCPDAAVVDLSPAIHQLRLVKSSAELSLMRRAGTLTGEAVVSAIRATQAGQFEYELGAHADFVFKLGGARGPGYRPIIASGGNIWNAHYYRNNCRLPDGDWVLMDYAPDVGCYTSDIGRYWPVGKRYSPRQRELYGFVVAYHQILIQILRPGRTTAELAREACERIRPTWEHWPFSKPAYRDAAQKMIASEVAFTHPVGMAVHDVGEYRREPLRAGIVFALDPQMWVHDEQLYVRVEDTVTITDHGVEVLTRSAPLDLNEIEQMRT